MSPALLPIPTATLSRGGFGCSSSGAETELFAAWPSLGARFGGALAALPCAISGVRWTNPNTGLFLSSSLKRTTDVMFGGKQVVVCGYGEVSFISGCWWSCESASPEPPFP